MTYKSGGRWGMHTWGIYLIQKDRETDRETPRWWKGTKHLRVVCRMILEIKEKNQMKAKARTEW